MDIFVDSEFKCYTADGEGRRAVELTEFATAFFDEKCPEFIEGHRYVPIGEKRVLPNGVMLRGEQISPWKDSRELERIQMQYERELLSQLRADLADADAALNKLGVRVDG